MDRQEAGWRLRAARHYRGLERLEDFAALLNSHGYELHYETLGRIERGKRELKLHEAKAISDVLDLPIEFLLGNLHGRPATKNDLKALKEQLDRLEARIA